MTYGNTYQPTANADTDSSKGPRWFAAMDANKHGDVSAREFLGTPEQFRALDTDDGFVDSVEAAVAERKEPRGG